MRLYGTVTTDRVADAPRTHVHSTAFVARRFAIRSYDFLLTSGLFGVWLHGVHRPCKGVERTRDGQSGGGRGGFGQESSPVVGSVAADRSGACVSSSSESPIQH